MNNDKRFFSVRVTQGYHTCSMESLRHPQIRTLHWQTPCSEEKLPDLWQVRCYLVMLLAPESSSKMKHTPIEFAATAISQHHQRCKHKATKHPLSSNILCTYAAGTSKAAWTSIGVYVATLQNPSHTLLKTTLQELTDSRIFSRGGEPQY